MDPRQNRKPGPVVPQRLRSEEGLCSLWFGDRFLFCFVSFLRQELVWLRPALNLLHGLELLILCPYLPRAGMTDMCFHSKLGFVFLTATALSANVRYPLTDCQDKALGSLELPIPLSLDSRVSCCSDGESEEHKDFL